MNLIKHFTCIVKHFNLYSCRKYASALYIPDSLANQEFSFFKPEITFDDDADQFQNEIDLRGYKFDVKKLKEQWDLFQTNRSNKQKLKDRQQEYSKKIVELQESNISENIESEINNLIMESKVLKAEIKFINMAISEFENNVIPEILKLPNRVDHRTPLEISAILGTVQVKLEISKNEIQSHLNVGTNLNLIDYKGPIQYYLCNETAYFEQLILLAGANILKASDFVRVTGSDLIKSVLVEGSGIDHEDPLKSFFVKDENNKKASHINRLHLVGNASIPSLLSFFTKREAKKHDFPVKIFTTGRQYTPLKNYSTDDGLLSVCQASVIQAMISVKDVDTCEKEFQDLILSTSKIYNKIGCHYRRVMRSISELNGSESLRISFEMWSAYLDEYIEVGNISLHGDYFSKRIMFAYKESKELKFPLTITGTLLSVPRVLACLLEENPKKFVLPKTLLNEFEGTAAT